MTQPSDRIVGPKAVDDDAVELQSNATGNIVMMAERRRRQKIFIDSGQHSTINRIGA
jgi:hypothetical protein